MRIALLTNGLFPYVVGGMQKHSVELARHFAESGVSVDIYYINDQRYPDPTTVAAELFGDDSAIRLRPVRHRKLPYFPGHHYPECLWNSWWIYQELKKAIGGIDFIYVQGYMGWSSLIARSWFGGSLPPLGVNFHGIEALQDEQTLSRTLKNCLAPIWTKWNMRRSDVAFSLGGQLDSIISSVRGGSESLIHSYNGISPLWIGGASRGGRDFPITRFLFVGRDAERKGIVELYEAVSQLAADDAFEMHFVGPIPEDRQVGNAKFHYYGKITNESELRRIYAECDVLVCPSHSEGFPTVILEALASGLRVIATDVGAVSLVVGPETGWLIPPRDVEALVAAMQAALEEDFWEGLDQRIAVAREYAWPQVAQRTAKSIENWLIERTD